MLLDVSAGHCLGVNHCYGGGKRRSARVHEGMYIMSEIANPFNMKGCISCIAKLARITGMHVHHIEESKLARIT